VSRVRGPLLLKIQRSLQSGKQRDKGLSEASDGPALVGNEVAAASEQKLQLGELLGSPALSFPRSPLIRAWSAMTRASRASDLDSPR
jgi:hypothetical protein